MTETRDDKRDEPREDQTARRGDDPEPRKDAPDQRFRDWALI